MAEHRPRAHRRSSMRLQRSRLRAAAAPSVVCRVLTLSIVRSIQLGQVIDDMNEVESRAEGPRKLPPAFERRARDKAPRSVATTTFLRTIMACGPLLSARWNLRSIQEWLATFLMSTGRVPVRLAGSAVQLRALVRAAARCPEKIPGVQRFFTGRWSRDRSDFHAGVDDGTAAGSGECHDRVESRSRCTSGTSSASCETRSRRSLSDARSAGGRPR